MQTSIFSIKNFTECTEQELEMILAWRNNAKTRSNSFQSEIIKKEDHFNYVKSLKNRKDRVYYLVLDNNGYFGVVGFTDITETKAAVSYYKKPERTGKGDGIVLLKIAESISRDASLFNGGGVETLITEVFASNIASIKSIERAGYVERAEKRYCFDRKGEKIDVLHYELAL